MNVKDPFLNFQLVLMSLTPKEHLLLHRCLSRL